MDWKERVNHLFGEIARTIDESIGDESAKNELYGYLHGCLLGFNGALRSGEQGFKRFIYATSVIVNDEIRRLEEL